MSSSMLEQAVIDAQALKEAAIKNAEQEVLEKYAGEIKEAVDTLLEQTEEEDLMGLEAEKDFEGASMIDPAAPEPDEFTDQIPMKALDGQDACPCPEDKEVVELDLDALMKAASDVEDEEDEVMFEANTSDLENLLNEEMEDDTDAEDAKEEEVEDALVDAFAEGKKFPDLTGDGKVTQADILKGRGVFEEEELEEELEEEIELDEESLKDAIAEIGKAKISTDDKIKLQQLIYEQQNKEMEEISLRWKADAASGSWLAANVRPMVLIWCIVVFSFAGILDSVNSIDFQIGPLWNDTFEKVMMAVVISYFGSRGIEKSVNIIKK